MIEHVLVAFDESPQATHALRHALETFPEADLTALHIVNPAEYGHTSEEIERARESAEDSLAAAVDIGREHGTDIETVIDQGGTSKTIVEFVESNDIDHVVLGSHGRQGISRFLLGSVAETVARRAPVSVTVIRGDDR